MMKGPGVVTLGVFLLFACGKRVATISPGPIPGTTETKLDMPTGRSLAFDVYVDKYKHDGTNALRMQVSLLKNGAVVASTECEGSSFRGRSGNGCQSLSQNNCPIMAPEGGADTVRVVTRFAESRAISVEGVEIRVKEK